MTGGNKTPVIFFGSSINNEGTGQKISNNDFIAVSCYIQMSKKNRLLEGVYRKVATINKSRRKFIGAIIFLLGGVFCLVKFLCPRVRQKKTLLTVAKADIPTHGALVYKASRVAVIKEAGETYALSLACTHLGCTVAVTPRDLVCPCHGSVFDRRGNVIRGPADRPLVRYVVEDRGDRIVVSI